MSLTILEKTALAVAGLIALGAGGSILVAPHAFYASYGIPLGSNASLLSELRAPGAGLAAFAGLILAGIWRPALTPASKVIALTIFLAYPLGRLVGLVIDGRPSGGILGALIFELAVALLCAVAFARRAGTGRKALSAIRAGH